MTLDKTRIVRITTEDGQTLLRVASMTDFELVSLIMRWGMIVEHDTTTIYARQDGQVQRLTFNGPNPVVPTL